MLTCHKITFRRVAGIVMFLFLFYVFFLQSMLPFDTTYKCHAQSQKHKKKIKQNRKKKKSEEYHVMARPNLNSNLTSAYLEPVGVCPCKLIWIRDDPALQELVKVLNISIRDSGVVPSLQVGKPVSRQRRVGRQRPRR